MRRRASSSSRLSSHLARLATTLEKFCLDGKVALTTGGTRGIRLAIARTFGEAGSRLVISSRSPVPEAERSLRNAGYEVDFTAAGPST